MTTLRLILGELAGLFVDDDSLAVAIIAIVALATLAAGVDAPWAVTGGALLGGCLLVLIVNVLRSAQRKP